MALFLLTSFFVVFIVFFLYSWKMLRINIMQMNKQLYSIMRLIVCLKFVIPSIFERFLQAGVLVQRTCYLPQ